MSNANRFVRTAALLGFVASFLALPQTAALAGGISGTIRDAQTGVPLGHIDLDVFDANFGPVLGIDDPGAPNNDLTATDGTFVLEPLPAGRYYLRADPSVLQGYVVQYFPGSFLQSQAIPVQVRATGTVNVDFYLVRGHLLEGTVVDELTNEPLVGVDMDVYGADGSFVSWVSALTDSLGQFSMGLVPDGSFYVSADPEGDSMYLTEFYGGTPTLAGSQAVPVGGGNVSGLEFKLDLGGSLSGVVTDRDTGTPLVDVDIDIFDLDGKLLPTANASTDSSGIYRVSSLPDGQYLVLADASAAQGYVDTFFGDTQDIGLATPVPVSAGTTASGTSITMARGGTIAGTVTEAATATPLAGVQVTLWVGATRAATAHTGANGTYLVGAVPAGDYIVRCAGVDSLGLAFQYHTGAVVASLAVPVAVTTGTSTGGIDFALQKGGYITGVVRTKTGAPLVGVKLDLFTPDGLSLPSLDRYSGADGFYLMGPIPAGTFVLRASPKLVYPEYTERYFGGTNLLTTALPLAVTAGNVLPQIDFLYGGIERPVGRRETQEIAATPNPFNPRTRIAFSLESAGPVKVTIHDVRGRILAVLADGVLAAGRHEFLWDGRGVLGQGTSSGVHFVRVETPTRIEKHKLILLK